MYSFCSSQAVVFRVQCNFLFNIVINFMLNNIWGFLFFLYKRCLLEITSLSIKDNWVDVIYLDICEVFYLVLHDILIFLKQHYEISIKRTLNEIRMGVTDQSRKAAISGESSSTGGVSSGFPQGSGLGPTLFNILISHL